VSGISGEDQFTGLRSRDECASLTWGQVDLKKGLVTYTKTKTTDEADDAVIIPLNSAALELLKKSDLHLDDAELARLEKKIRQSEET